MGTRSLQTDDTRPSLRDLERRYQEIYTDEAGEYDQVRFQHARGRSFNVAEQNTIFALLGLQPGQSVLDAPAGTGRIATFLAERQLAVTAVDITHGMLREAQAKTAAANLPNVRYVQATARQLPFADKTFDAVISIRFFHLLPVAMHRPFILELWRVLRPGGVLLANFTSALAGGVVNWIREPYRRYLRGRKPRYYLWPHQVPSLFAGTAPVSIHGFSPVGLNLVQGLHPNGATAFERFVASGWRSFLANRVFVRVVKQ